MELKYGYADNLFEYAQFKHFLFHVLFITLMRHRSPLFVLTRDVIGTRCFCAAVAFSFREKNIERIVFPHNPCPEGLGIIEMELSVIFFFFFFWYNDI